MFKKATFLILICLAFAPFSYGQYEDDAPQKSDVADTSVDGISPTLKEKLVPGLEFMLSPNSGVFFAELSPFIAYKVKEPLLVGAGLHGSFLGASNYGNFTYFGAHAFVRLTIADQFFLQGEYRLLNGAIPGSRVRREWMGSPIGAFGMMYGDASYMMIGYAFNADFQSINPLRGFVYRIGIYFN
ncbi:MAG: hypothetical protein KG003_02940 [Bacteroidetes bacterium]|nr:hypothetical protein [Bacteroidota bacterium]